MIIPLRTVAQINYILFMGSFAPHCAEIPYNRQGEERFSHRQGGLDPRVYVENS